MACKMKDYSSNTDRTSSMAGNANSSVAPCGSMTVAKKVSRADAPSFLSGRGARSCRFRSAKGACVFQMVLFSDNIRYLICTWGSLVTKRSDLSCGYKPHAPAPSPQKRRAALPDAGGQGGRDSGPDQEGPSTSRQSARQYGCSQRALFAS